MAAAEQPPLESFDQLTDWEAARARWLLETSLHATDPRPNQLTPPGDWLVWVVMSGRMWGKTRAAVEDVSDYARQHPGARIAGVFDTFGEGRDIGIEGESGLLSVVPPSAIKHYNRSLGEFIFTNGARFDIYSSENPEGLRGPNLARAWCDELAKWSNPSTTWDNLMFALRKGKRPQVVVTTTPRPIQLLRDLIAQPGTLVTRGTSFDNARNVSESALAELKRQHEGNRLGRQELYGELLDDLEGALFKRQWFAGNVVEPDAVPRREMRWVRYWDLAATKPLKHGDDPDWTVGALVGLSKDGQWYLADIRRVRESPLEVERLVYATAEEDRTQRMEPVAVRMEQEPGASGVQGIDHYRRAVLVGFDFDGHRPSGDKTERARPVSSAAESGNVFMVRGEWNRDFLDEVEVFPSPKRHDDQVDAVSGAMAVMSSRRARILV